MSGRWRAAGGRQVARGENKPVSRTLALGIWIQGLLIRVKTLQNRVLRRENDVKTEQQVAKVEKYSAEISQKIHENFEIMCANMGPIVQSNLVGVKPRIDAIFEKIRVVLRLFK